MEDFDKGKFETLMNATASMYNRTPSDGTQLMMYFNALNRFSFQDVQTGFNAHIQNPDNGQFFPKPADIIRYMDGGSETQAGAAWTKVDKSIRTVGPYQNIVFDDRIIHAVIADMGGWILMCGTSDQEYPFKKNEFVKRYTGYRSRPPEDYPRLLGGIAQQTNDMRKLGTIEAPVIIGSMEDARLTYSGGSESGKKTVHRISMAELTGKPENAIADQSKPLEGDLKAMLTNLEDGDVLFIDEIHRLSP
ncbi:MAG: DUF6475 domain-containing protein, partial [Oleispira sp.]